ncbi:hypothetical protein DPSP01_006028 [Paraphaeosphaeria sporulosa]
MQSLPDTTIYSTHMSQSMEKGLSNSGSSASSHSHNRNSSSPETSSTKLPASKSSSSTTLTDPARVEKRKANTMAARRYRQKRVDQMNTLESQLKDTQTERDALKVRCARLEGEVETLRALLAAKK